MEKNEKEEKGKDNLASLKASSMVTLFVGMLIACVITGAFCYRQGISHTKGQHLLPAEDGVVYEVTVVGTTASRPGYYDLSIWSREFIGQDLENDLEKCEKQKVTLSGIVVQKVD